MIGNDTYWFSRSGDEVAKGLQAHHGDWLRWGSNPIIQAWLRNSVAYYSTILEANDWQTSLNYAGEMGELVRMSVPQARQIIRQIITLTTKQRLSFKAIAEASGRDVMQAVKIGNALTESIVTDEDLDQKQEHAVEHACVYGTGFFKTTWRTDRGEPYAVMENQELLYNGDIEITTPSVYDVYYDYRLENWSDVNWAEVRTIKNRWDLIAQFPDMKEDILRIPRIGVRDRIYDTTTQAQIEQEDMIYVYEVYHKPTPAMPQGRMLFYSDEHTIYYDGPNAYECIPIVPIRPENVHMLGFGYPILSNLLPSQEMYDHSISAIATNQSAFAVQQILCPRGADVSVQDVGGLNFVFFTPQNTEGGGKPEPLQLTQSAPETYKFAEVLKGTMLELSNLNGAVRGQPPPGVTSGTAIATLTANSLEFLSSLSKALDLALERVMEISLRTYKNFAQTPRQITITNQNQKTYSYDFEGKDLEPIKKIRITRSNPLMSTLAGRSDVAEKLLQTGLIKDPQQYFKIIEGAPADELYSTELSETDLMDSENEALQRGEDVLALATDDHPKHIMHHNAILNDPEMRKSSTIVQMVLEHIEEHYRLARETDPGLQAMVRTGQLPQGGLMPSPGPEMQGGAPGVAGALGPSPQGTPLPPGEETQLPQDIEPGMATASPAQPAQDNLGRNMQGVGL